MVFSQLLEEALSEGQILGVGVGGGGWVGGAVGGMGWGVREAPPPQC